MDPCVSCCIVFYACKYIFKALFIMYLYVHVLTIQCTAYMHVWEHPSLANTCASTYVLSCNATWPGLASAI